MQSEDITLSLYVFLELKHKQLETGIMSSKQMGLNLYQAVRSVYMYIKQTSIPALENIVLSF